MTQYARIQDGVVAELFSTEEDISMLFNPALVWVSLPEGQSVTEGWTFENSVFAPPVPAADPAQPTIAELQAQLDLLSARIAALKAQS